MTRIDFTDAKLPNFAQSVAPGAADKGIRIHSKLGAIIHNIFAKCGFCSRVVQYQCSLNGNIQVVYLNEISLIKWMLRHGVDPVMQGAKTAKKIALAVQNPVANPVPPAPAKKAEMDDF